MQTALWTIGGCETLRAVCTPVVPKLYLCEAAVGERPLL